MHIGQAIARVKELRSKIEGVDNALNNIDKTHLGNPAKFSATVWVESAGNTNITIGRDEVVALLQSTKRGFESEISKLQPVIDMANAALKGVLS